MEGDLIMAWEEFKVSGVTENTPKSILLNAGTLYRNMVYGLSLIHI